MRGYFLTKVILSFIMMLCHLIFHCAYAFPVNLKSAIDYAFIHHPNIQHAKLDLNKIDYDLNIETDRFLPKLFWHSEIFHETEASEFSYHRQGIMLGPLMHWHLPIGTKVTGNLGTELGQNYQDVSRMGISIKQPLIKNVGKKINQDTLIQTKIQQDILLISYEKILEEMIIQVSTNYFNYAQMVLTNRVQLSSLEQAKKYLKQVHCLVETGRLAKNEIEQPALYLENQESLKEESKQRLSFNRLMLLKSMGVVEGNAFFLENTEKIESKITQEIDLLLFEFKKKYDLSLATEFVPIDKDKEIYDNQFKLIEQNKLVAKDETKWNMNLEGYAFIREQEKQYGLNLSLDLPINDKLRRYQSLYHLNIDKEKLSDHQQRHAYYYPKKIIFERQEVESKFKQLRLAIRMRELAEKSVKTAELKWQVGRTTLFELIQLSTQFQQSEIELVKAKIAILNTGFDYFKSLGILTKHWTQ